MWLTSILVLLVLLTAPAAAVPVRSPLDPLGAWPVDSPVVLSAFAAPAAQWSAGHRGVDVAAASGDVVRAMASGTVSFVGSIAGKPVVTVLLPGSDRRRSTYEPVIATVGAGDLVTAGQQIGVVAVTGGHCGGARGCLHVGLRTDDGYLDPLSLVRRPPAVLKPLRQRPRSG